MDSVYGVHFFLVQGHKDWDHDGDKWIGIYDNLTTLKDRYRAEEFRLYQEKKMLRIEQMNRKKNGKKKAWDIGDYDLGEIMVSAFDELSGKWTYDVDLDGDPFPEITSDRLTQDEINFLLGSTEKQQESEKSGDEGERR